MKEKFYAVVFSYQEYFVKESKVIILMETLQFPSTVADMVKDIISDIVARKGGPVYDNWLFQWPVSINWVSDSIPGSSITRWDDYDLAFIYKAEEGSLTRTDPQTARYIYVKTNKPKKY